jgi:hypothetical protein
MLPIKGMPCSISIFKMFSHSSDMALITNWLITNNNINPSGKGYIYYSKNLWGDRLRGVGENRKRVVASRQDLLRTVTVEGKFEGSEYDVCKQLHTVLALCKPLPAITCLDN